MGRVPPVEFEEAYWQKQAEGAEELNETSLRKAGAIQCRKGNRRRSEGTMKQ